MKFSVAYYDEQTDDTISFESKKDLPITPEQLTNNTKLETLVAYYKSRGLNFDEYGICEGYSEDLFEFILVSYNNSNLLKETAQCLLRDAETVLDYTGSDEDFLSHLTELNKDIDIYQGDPGMVWS